MKSRFGENAKSALMWIRYSSGIPLLWPSLVSGHPNSNRINSKMATFEQLIPSKPSLSRETQTLQFCHMVSLRHFKTRLEDKLDFYGCLNSILIKMQSKNLWLKFSFCIRASDSNMQYSIMDVKAFWKSTRFRSNINFWTFNVFAILFGSGSQRTRTV